MVCRMFLTAHGSVVLVCDVPVRRLLSVACVLWVEGRWSRPMTGGLHTSCALGGFLKYDLAALCTWNPWRMFQS